MEGDSVAVDLLLDGGNEGKGGALGPDGDLAAVQRDGTGAVMAVLDHTEYRYGIAVPVHHGPDGRHVPLPAVEEDQVGQGAEALVLPLVRLVFLHAAGQHLPHRGVVVLSVHGFDLEFSVSGFQGTAVLEYHHPRDVVAAAGIGNIVAFDPHGRRG